MLSCSRALRHSRYVKELQDSHNSNISVIYFMNFLQYNK
ncbi:Uncharacterized protein dnm_056340 [Desulfonema magnum]|uniref:Uncharacterized protein n=1 Tax=Desulfonema magnum TaxID=45655 RepID=A0A975GR22_9BACT|nr:Uncharacterized protein dnm_056340 [Desulfonema magnum]